MKVSVQRVKYIHLDKGLECIYTVSERRALFGPRREKTCLRGFANNKGADQPARVFANNKGADQPAHPRSLIGAFVIHLLESSISKLASSKISIF